jgi:hypothetical protein
MSTIQPEDVIITFVVEDVNESGETTRTKFPIHLSNIPKDSLLDCLRRRIGNKFAGTEIDEDHNVVIKFSAKYFSVIADYLENRDPKYEITRDVIEAFEYFGIRMKDWPSDFILIRKREEEFRSGFQTNPKFSNDPYYGLIELTFERYKEIIESKREVRKESKNNLLSDINRRLEEESIIFNYVKTKKPHKNIKKAPRVHPAKVRANPKKVIKPIQKAKQRISGIPGVKRTIDDSLAEIVQDANNPLKYVGGYPVISEPTSDIVNLAVLRGLAILREDENGELFFHLANYDSSKKTKYFLVKVSDKFCKYREGPIRCLEEKEDGTDFCSVHQEDKEHMRGRCSGSVSGMRNCGNRQFANHSYCGNCIKIGVYKYHDYNLSNKIGVVYDQIKGVNILRAFELEKGRWDEDFDDEIKGEVDENNNNNSSTFSGRKNMNSLDNNESESASNLKLRAEYDLIFANLHKLTSPLNNHLISKGGNFLVAGGSIISIIFGSKVTDIDLFYCGAGKDDANDGNFISEMTEMIKNKVKQEHEILMNDTSIIRTDKSITLKTTSPMWLGLEKQQDEKKFKSVLPFQFILRGYKTPSEVLHGFDVDCCCIGYDGSKIWLSERCFFSLNNMINVVDFDRLSPTYEYRLSKYARRYQLRSHLLAGGEVSNAFAIYVPSFDLRKYDRVSILDTVGTLKIIRQGTIKEPRSIFKVSDKYHQNNPTYLEYLLVDDMLNRSGNCPLKSNKTKSDYEDGWFVNFTLKMMWELDALKASGYSSNTLTDAFNPTYRESFRDSDDEDKNKKDQIVKQYPYADKANKESMTPLKLKRMNPGEQVTSTFHKLVLEDERIWYKVRPEFLIQDEKD